MQKQLTDLIIVDDERLARKDLISLLSKHPSINVVGEADNVSAAIQAIEQPNPDAMHKINRLLDNINCQFLSEYYVQILLAQFHKLV